MAQRSSQIVREYGRYSAGDAASSIVIKKKIPDMEDLTNLHALSA